VARVIVGAARAATADPGTIEGLCRACPHGPSASKYKKDCAREGELPADLRDLTRILIAWLSAQREGGRIVEYVEADGRTVRTMFERGGLTWLLDRPDAPIEDILDRQHFVRNPAVVSAIRRLWPEAEMRDKGCA
jgi:hypothetical protein